ncbi:enoyl-CoA hydratase-related protein [Nocardia transvalensis]|uniref:enoyl-CoA hydratase-related protein n=1 Tax=Nocardia transvalensis TaxID=37333 RepID=UPI00189582E0|nr:enoyl-CoA hydratase-related protein [Nocardia transvalensis]MBF6327674.1 enoyl-CoA hydratase/isomerase family protein [Nocardia transvalensis]
MGANDILDRSGDECPLLVEREGAVAVVTMNRPERRNALNLPMIQQLADAWEQIDADDEIRVAILTGAGDTYCVGGDLGDGWMTNGSGRADYDPAVIGRGLLLTHCLRKPLIAAVNGACLGGGLEMLQQTDIRIAEEQATFGLPEVRRGLIPGAGSTVRLKRQIPYTKAVEMILTGDPLTAREAYDFGLIGHVVPTGQALARAHDIADRVVRNSPLAVQQAKAALLASGWLPDEQARAIEQRFVRTVIASADAREGRKAFVEKREPRFSGR